MRVSTSHVSFANVIKPFSDRAVSGRQKAQQTEPTSHRLVSSQLFQQGGAWSEAKAIQNLNRALWGLTKEAVALRQKLSVVSVVPQGQAIEEEVTSLADVLKAVFTALDGFDNGRESLPSDVMSLAASLSAIRDIIVAAVEGGPVMRTCEGLDNDSEDTSFSLRDVLLGRDHRGIREIISQKGSEVHKSLDTIAKTLLENLPVYVDPRGGLLVRGSEPYENGTGREAGRISSYLEELEERKGSLEARLSVIEELIANSRDLISGLSTLPREENVAL